MIPCVKSRTVIKKRLYPELTDEELITRILLDQQTELFEILYYRYHRKVLDKCYSLLKNRGQSLEFTEDILSKVYEKLSTFGKRASFSSWLYTITYNHCIDYLREKKNLHYPDWNRQNEIPEIIYFAEDDLQDINYDNLSIILDLIHPEEKAMLMMKYHDDLSMKEVAASLRISVDAAKMRLKRARTRVFYLYKKKFLEKNEE
jgi:RNA polymerase sigma factor (sigma-70 family)